MDKPPVFLVLGAATGAEASFQQLADVFAQAVGKPTPFLVWTEPQLQAFMAALPTVPSVNDLGLLALLDRLLAPLGANAAGSPVVLYVVAAEGDRQNAATQQVVGALFQGAQPNVYDRVRGLIVVAPASILEDSSPQLGMAIAGMRLMAGKYPERNQLDVVMAAATPQVASRVRSWGVGGKIQTGGNAGTRASIVPGYAPEEAVAAIKSIVYYQGKVIAGGAPSPGPTPTGPGTPEAAKAAKAASSPVTVVVVVGAVALGAYLLLRK